MVKKEHLGAIKAVSLLVALLAPSAVYGQNSPLKPVTGSADNAACAIHIEGSYDIKHKLDEIGCAEGDSLLIYNFSTLSRWETILPVRAAATLVCDMSMTITDIGAVGAKPYQSVICTYSGKVRRLKSNGENLKGWGF